jgi:hypothetical protein
MIDGEDSEESAKGGAEQDNDVFVHEKSGTYSGYRSGGADSGATYGGSQ